jgi:uncharacterized protein YdaU (DUF1376 family)
MGSGAVGSGEALMQGNGNGKLQAEWFWGNRWTTSRGFLLPMAARGLYREMLTQAWIRGGSLPRVEDDLKRIVGATPDEWRRYWPLVKPFWRVVGDRLVNDTQREIYAEAERRATFASEHGSKAARARWINARVMPE